MKNEKCLEIIKKNEQYTKKEIHYFPLVIKECKGSIITDYDGKTYIDFLSSGSSLNLGSYHPVVTKAIKEQLDRFSQYIFGYVQNWEAREYARLLTSVYPGGIKAKVAYTNSGSESIDTAIKYARVFTGRQKIIYFINSYHGTTYGAISVSGHTIDMRNKMGPFLPEVYPFPFYGNNVSDEVAEKESTKSIEEAFQKYLPADEIAAAFVEAVQGDTGILPAHPIFMKKLYNLCKKNGILLIIDDIQQGFFRSGKMFSIENYEGIIPDGICLAKSFGAGLVGGCFLAREEIIDSLGAPGHLSTFHGNPLTCAAGIAAFGIYYSKEFQDLLQSNIKLLDQLGKDLKEKHQDIIESVRNIGMSMGIDIKDKDGGNTTYKIIFRCYEKGLFITTLNGNILRIQPPLNTPSELLVKGFNIISESIEDFKGGRINDGVLEYKKSW